MIERKVRETLNKLGVHYLQEYPIWRYSIDFFLPDRQIALEVDGSFWHSQPHQIAKDRRRDLFLQLRGITTIRLPGQEILNASDLCGLVEDRLGEIA